MAGCPLLGPYAHLNPEDGPADPGPRTASYHPFLKLHGEMEAKSKAFGFHLGRPTGGTNRPYRRWRVQGQPQLQNEFQASLASLGRPCLKIYRQLGLGLEFGAGMCKPRMPLGSQALPAPGFLSRRTP